MNQLMKTNYNPSWHDLLSGVNLTALSRHLMISRQHLSYVMHDHRRASPELYRRLEVIIEKLNRMKLRSIRNTVKRKRK